MENVEEKPADGPEFQLTPGPEGPVVRVGAPRGPAIVGGLALMLLGLVWNMTIAGGLEGVVAGGAQLLSIVGSIAMALGGACLVAGVTATRSVRTTDLR